MDEKDGGDDDLLRQYVRIEAPRNRNGEYNLK